MKNMNELNYLNHPDDLMNQESNGTIRKKRKRNLCELGELGKISEPREADRKSPPNKLGAVCVGGVSTMKGSCVQRELSGKAR